MSEREEVYRAAREARAGFVDRTRRGMGSGTDAVTRMVDAAVYRYEHRVPDGDTTREPGARSTEDTSEEAGS